MISTYIKNAIHHIGTIYFSIHFNSGVFTIQIFHYTIVALYIKNIISFVDSPDITNKTAISFQRIGHTMIDQLPIFRRFIIPELINTTCIDTLLSGRCQYRTYIRKVIHRKYRPDVSIKLHHTVLICKVHPMIIIRSYFPSLSTFTIKAFIEINNEAIPTGNCLAKRE